MQCCVNDLLTLGLVTSTPNPLHRRSHLIDLTEVGATRLARLRAAEDASLGRLASKLPPEDAEAALRVLTALIEHLRRRVDTARTAGTGAEDQAESVDGDAHRVEGS